MIKFIFGTQINKVFLKFMVSFWEMLSILVSTARHAQSTQNKKFALSLQYFQKMWGMKLVFRMKINAEIFFKLIVSL